ncbi:MAG: hypothetical protein GX430_11820, partial [Treponema sp.]|nr:hypothetical protein [Treponema sp.]
AAIRQAPAQSGPRLSIAVLGLENAGGDPRQDYLASTAEGILRYDLSVLADIPMVERRNLDKLLSEREFSLSSVADPARAARAGGLLGASHLVYGDYAVTAGELNLTVHLLDTASGQAVTFRDRGASEHVVHRIAEKIAARLLDRRGVVFADAANDRSILSLRDETPGVIALHSPIRAAEIYLDEEFVGFTRGNELDPILLESVRPGRHTLRVHLSGGDFGVVLLPQVEFKDWETVIDVRPGGRHAVRDQTRHFNETLYRLEHLLSFELKAERGKASALAFSKDLTFTDRTGRTVPVKLVGTPSETADGASITLVLTAGGEDARGRISAPARPDAPTELRIIAGTVALEAELSDSWGSWELDVTVRRTDVYQGLHREKP